MFVDKCTEYSELNGVGAALAPQPLPTFKLRARIEVEIGDALWQVLDIP